LPLPEVQAVAARVPADRAKIFRAGSCAHEGLHWKTSTPIAMARVGASGRDRLRPLGPLRKRQSATAALQDLLRPVVAIRGDDPRKLHGPASRRTSLHLHLPATPPRFVRFPTKWADAATSPLENPGVRTHPCIFRWRPACMGRRPTPAMTKAQQ